MKGSVACMYSKVLVLMSTYNGGEKIARQIESILNQSSVEVSINIRDDGSEEETLNSLKKLEKLYPRKINIDYGINIGWKQSFLELVYKAQLKYDYYGFSDQDDMWFTDKLKSCITLMKNNNRNGAKLAHCNCLSVDETLQVRSEQELRISCPPNFKAALATEYFQGCGMVWNSDAMKLIQKHNPKNIELAHDYWVGLVCYLFGQIYFCEDAKFYHIRYDNNSSEDGNIKKGRMKRLKYLIKGGGSYMNPAEDLMIGYHDELTLSQQKFLKYVVGYKKCMRAKIALLIDKNFKRPSIMSTLLFKTSVLINRY